MDGSLLELLVDELFDVTEAQRELEKRATKLRNAVRAELDAAGLSHAHHPRGTVRVATQRAFAGLSPTRALPVVAPREWWDDAFIVNGRALHRLASAEDAAMREIVGLGATLRESRVLSVTSSTRRRGAA